MSESPRPGTTTPPQGTSPYDAPPGARLTRLARALRPEPTTTTSWWESLAVLVVAAVVAYFRLGRAPLRGVVWAEDGTVFLADAHHLNLVTGAFEPYNGYALFLPRVAAEVISWAPLTWQGQLTSVAAVLAQSCVALVVFHVLRAHARTRIPPLLAAATVAAVPVGIEVVDNLANSQWFLLAGAVLAVFWTPRLWRGRLASAVLVFVAATTCVFAAFASGLAVLGWLVDRRRENLPVAVAGLVGTATQGWVAIHAPPRSGPLDPGLDLEAQVAGYLRRVVGDGVLGAGRHGLEDSPSVVPGLLVLLAVALMAGSLLARHQGDRLLVPGVLALCSIVLFAAPVYLTDPNTVQSFSEGRYWVAPVIVLVAAILLVAEAAWLARRGRSGWLPAVLAVLTAVALTAGLVTSWKAPSWDARRTGPDWSKQVEQARRHCEQHPRQPAVIDISPPGWTVTLRCSDVR